MKRYAKVLALILFFSGIVIAQNEFVIKKKKKKISKSKLQEQTCQVFGSHMAVLPDAHQKIAEIQKMLLDQTCKYLENSKQGVILKCNKNALVDVLKVSEDFEDTLDQFCKNCDKYLKYLKDL